MTMLVKIVKIMLAIHNHNALRKSARFSYSDFLYTFFLIVILGTVLFMLPISNQNGKPMSFIDAFFLATSGITTTGLATIDPGSGLTLFGQFVLLSLFQIGGLGYMIFIVFIAYAINKKLSIKTNRGWQESTPGVSAVEPKVFIQTVLFTTLIAEVFGAVLLTIFWIRQFPLTKAIYYGIFHSVSAFCTAGFGLFSDSLSSYEGSILINSVICLLSITGGIGFYVIHDIFSNITKKAKGIRCSLSVHSRLAIYTSMILMLTGAVLFFVFDTRFMPIHIEQQILGAIFQSVSASTTTGFNSIDIGKMSVTSLFFLELLMYAGSSPGSTGGGIKNTTFSLNVLSASATLRGRRYVNIFGRHLSQDTLNKALAIGLSALILIFSCTLILSITENQPLLNILFEVTSALGTVGLSMGITSSLSFTGKIIISILMFIGRVGPLTASLGLFLGSKPPSPDIKYPEVDVFVG